LKKWIDSDLEKVGEDAEEWRTITHWEKMEEISNHRETQEKSKQKEQEELLQEVE